MASDETDMSRPDVAGFGREVRKGFTPRHTALETSPRLKSKLVADHANTYLTAGKGGRKSHSGPSIKALSKPQTRKRK